MDNIDNMDNLGQNRPTWTIYDKMDNLGHKIK